MLALPYVKLGIEAYGKTCDVMLAMLEGADPDTRATIIRIWVEREAWWQDNVWSKLGDLVDREGGDPE